MTSQSESNAIPNEESRPKSKWKVTNWPEYDRALVQRGDVTVWLDEEFVRALVNKLSNAINYRPKATVPENYHDQSVRIKNAISNKESLPKSKWQVTGLNMIAHWCSEAT